MENQQPRIARKINPPHPDLKYDFSLDADFLNWTYTVTVKQSGQKVYEDTVEIPIPIVLHRFARGELGRCLAIAGADVKIPSALFVALLLNSKNFMDRMVNELGTN